MLHHSNQVVNFSPENQDSVLGRIVAGESCLELLQNIKRFIAYGRAMAEIRAELAALRARPHRETLFSFTVGDDVEPSSGKSALELCWETLERVQFLNRRIALYQYAEERIECSGKFYYFLIRVAGIVGGSVAASKFMDDPRNDCRVRDYLAEDECADHLIESISVGTEELAQIEGARKTYSPEAKIGVESYVAWCFRLDKQGEAAECERERKSHPSPKRGSTPEEISEFLIALAYKVGVCSWVARCPDTNEANLEYKERVLQAKLMSRVSQRRTASPQQLEEYAARHRNDETVTVPHLPNYCLHCSMWVTNLHEGENCAAKLATTLEVQCANETAKRVAERRLYAAHVAKTLEPYFSAIRERVILSSRGTVTRTLVKELDGKMVRKLSKTKDAETGRKIGLSKARELWNQVAKESTCQQEPLLEYRVALK